MLVVTLTFGFNSWNRSGYDRYERWSPMGDSVRIEVDDRMMRY